MTHPPAPQPAFNPTMTLPPQQISEKSFLATWLFSWLLGGIGVDRFYLGQIGTGVLKLVTFGGFGIWYLIDLVLTLTGLRKDKVGLCLYGYEQYKTIAWIVTAVAFAISAVLGGIAGVNAPDASVQSSQTGAAAPDQVADLGTEPTSEPEKTPAETAAPEKALTEESSETAAPEEPEVSAEPEVPAEYRSALTKAETYSDMMRMSKAGIFDQLTSEYGEGFSDEAAQYAVDNVEADWNENVAPSACWKHESIESVAQFCRPGSGPQPSKARDRHRLPITSSR